MIKFNKVYNTLDQLQLDRSVDINHFHNYGNYRLVHTCTAALEIAALALDIKEGDEVIMPSYTFVSTANAFVLRGAKIIFCDVTEDMNMDLDFLEQLFTEKTKAVVVVHYAGCGADMKRLSDLCGQKNIALIEDAAQAIGVYQEDKLLGTFGDFGCISFHQTKNIHCFEGGMLIINNDKYSHVVDQIINMGTDKDEFFAGEVKQYTWQRMGSSYKMDDLRASYLRPQFSVLDYINRRRVEIVTRYQEALKDYDIFTRKDHNGHLFYIKVEDRDALKNYLFEKGVEAFSHYEPLHESKAGKKFGRTPSELTRTVDAYKLLRLPVYFELTNKEIDYITSCIKEYYE